MFYRRVTDLNERAALEQQIMEFGQTPKQLFTTPHPCKLPHTEPANKNPPLLSRVSDTENTELSTSCQNVTETSAQTNMLDTKKRDTFWDGIEGRLDSANVVCEHGLHKDAVTCVTWDEQGKNVYSVGKGL